MAAKQKNGLGYWIARTFIYLFLIVLALSFLYPVFYMIFNSLKTQAEYMKDPFSIDFVNGHYENYWVMINNFNILKYFWNTLVVDVAGLSVNLFLSIIASYAFAKLKFVGQHKAYLAILIVMFIPAQVTILPTYVMFAKMGLINSLFGLTLMNIAGGQAGTILLLTANFRSIPNEMIEAAKMDGCSYFRTIWKIAVPMALPAVSISIILSFIGTWNDLFRPMVMIKDLDKQLIMPALSNLVSRFSKDMPLQLTGLLMASIPAIIIYLLLQKKIVMGVCMGSIK